MKKALLVVIAIVAILIGCGFSDFAGSSGDKTSSLLLSFGDRNIKTLLPSISMECSSYTVTGNGPGIETFTIDTSNSSLEVYDLVIGTWNITVQGKNLDGTIIGQGTGITEILVGVTSVLDVVVTPLAGAGTLDLTVSWYPPVVNNPQIFASMTTYTGEPILFGNDFTITGDEENKVGTTAKNFDAGWHTLILKLNDDLFGDSSLIHLAAGAVEVVRIVYNETTYGNYELLVNQYGGFMDVNIIPEMNNPLILTPSIPFGTIQEGIEETKIITMSADTTDNIIWMWYMNGDLLDSDGNNNISIVGSTLNLGGNYRLDVTGFTIDGERAGSGTWQVVPVEVVEPTYNLNTINGILEKPFYTENAGPLYVEVDNDLLRTNGNIQRTSITVSAESVMNWDWVLEDVPNGVYYIRASFRDDDKMIYYEEIPGTPTLITIPHTGELHDITLTLIGGG